ncbi:MAG: hypothetical protein IJ551_09330 [Prevotella sp.]|nr:hypothetical protein [Prevotella sp.]
MVSCDKDDDDPSQLIGLWEHTWNQGDGTTTTESYYFDEAGWGDYSSGSGWTGSFTYTVESPGAIRFKMVYQQWVGGNGSYKDEFVWPYSIKAGKLTLNGKTYTLTARELETINIP